MAFKKISFAQANWDKDINSNFDNVVHDTGWQPFNLVAPATGALQYRVLNSILYFNGLVILDNSEVKLGYFPTVIKNKSFIVKGTANKLAFARIENDSSLIVNIDTVSLTNISFDGIALYVGDIINLGGVIDRLLSHVRQAFSYFHKEMEVA